MGKLTDRHTNFWRNKQYDKLSLLAIAADSPPLRILAWRSFAERMATIIRCV